MEPPRDGDEEAVAALAGLDVDLRLRRANGAEMLLEELRDLRGGLVRDESHGNLRMGRGRQDGLRALDLVDVQESIVLGHV